MLLRIRPRVAPLACIGRAMRQFVRTTGYFCIGPRLPAYHPFYLIMTLMPRSLLHWRLALAGALSVVTALSLLPLGPDAPTTGWDKTNHLLAFGWLAIVGCRAWPQRHAAALAGLLAYGGLIEVLQSFTGYRSAEWGDLLADALGLLLGWALLRSVQLIRTRR
jgi:VanZ family protein